MKPTPLLLDGIRALTDETGMFQHTKYSTIDRREGYTTDDNARALIAALRHYQIYKDPDALRLADTYLPFLLHMQRTDGRFHNLLGFDRRFQDDVGSEGCMGRALWATGYTLRTDVPDEDKNVAKDETAKNELIEKSGQMGVPVIIIEGHDPIIGFDVEAIKKALNL